MPDDRDDTKTSRSSTSPRVLVQYHLQRHGQDTSILAGSVVLSRESMISSSNFTALSFITMITLTFARYLLTNSHVALD
jgi:hypothetical protein